MTNWGLPEIDHNTMGKFRVEQSQALYPSLDGTARDMWCIFLPGDASDRLPEL